MKGKKKRKITSPLSSFLSISPPPYFYQFHFPLIFINSTFPLFLSIPPPPYCINSFFYPNLSIPFEHRNGIFWIWYGWKYLRKIKKISIGIFIQKNDLEKNRRCEEERKEKFSRNFHSIEWFRKKKERKKEGKTTFHFLHFYQFLFLLIFINCSSFLFLSTPSPLYFY